jgi:hypothetical protein
MVSSLNAARTNSFSKELCQTIDANTEFYSSYCVLVGNEKKLVLLYGDSHAEALAYEAKKAFANTDFGLIIAEQSACPPVKGVYWTGDSDKRACYEQNNKVYDYIEDSPLIEYVILSARWNFYIEGVGFDNKEGGIEPSENGHLDIVENGEYLYHEDYGHRDAIAQAYSNSIQSLLDTGKKVILVYPVPEAGWNVPDYLSRYYFSDAESVFYSSTASTSHEVFKARNKRAINALDGVQTNANLIRVFPENLFCDNDIPERCITQKDGVIFYRDDDHLSDEGNRLIVERIMSQLENPR